MTKQMHDRRSILKTGLGLGASAGLMGALPGLGSMGALANGGGYKAIVCIMLEGGMDGHDTLIPTAPGAYAQYAGPRAAILNDHEGRGDDSRVRENLIALDNGAAPSGFGMPRQFAPLAALHRAGALSVVSNVGMLKERTNRAAIQDGRAVLPTRLGSHNDQLSLWHTGVLEGTSDGFGWGGEMTAATGGVTSPFASVSFTNNAAFASSSRRAPYRMRRNRIDLPAGENTNRYPAGVRALFAEHYRASAAPLDSLFATDFQNAQRSAVEAAQTLHAAGADNPAGEAVRITGNTLSEKLAMTAKMISLRAQFGLSRQVFLIDHGGFDTHANQAGTLPGLQAQLADAMAAFYRETMRQGVADQVLTFTTAEFGRSLTPNANGTDHGWGNHHFVMGGGIRGGVIHGDLPEVGLGHDLDWDRGRLIPTTAVEQYAGGVGRWFGVAESDLGTILPTMGRFGAPLAL